MLPSNYRLYLIIATVNIFCTITIMLYMVQYMQIQGGGPSACGENGLQKNNPFAKTGARSMASDVVPSLVSGLDYLRAPKLFKGMAFSLEERQTLGIHGLLPPRIKTQEEMAEHSMRNLRRFDDPLNKYMYMADLSERNEKLFYKLLSENTMELMPVVYTPTVGLACQKFGFAFKRPQGLFISIHDKGHVDDVIKNC